jgi:hypothetical protein
MVKVQPVCIGCAHFDQSNPEAMRCSAFPQGIPMEIATGRLVHRKPYVGDQGLRYQPRHVYEPSNIMQWKSMEHGSNSGRNPLAYMWDLQEEAS